MVTRSVSAFARDGDLKRAQKLLDVVQPLQTVWVEGEGLNALLEAYVRAHRFEAVVSVLQRMQQQGVRLELEGLEQWALQALDTQNVELVQQQVDALMQAGYPCTEILEAMIRKRMEWGHLQEALSIARRLAEGGERASPGCVDAVVDGFAKAGEWDRVKDVIALMGPPSIHKFRWMVGSCATAQRAAEAEAVVDMMKTAGVTPDPIVLRALYNVYRQTGDRNGARSVLQKIREGGVSAY